MLWRPWLAEPRRSRPLTQGSSHRGEAGRAIAAAAPHRFGGAQLQGASRLKQAALQASRAMHKRRQ